MISDIKIPRKEIKQLLKKTVKHAWSQRWTNLENNKLREIKDTIDESHVRDSTNRKWEISVTRLKIGHTKFTHRYLLNREEPPLCEDCIVPLTVKHILIECPSYEEQRIAHFNTNNPSLKDILNNNSFFRGPLYEYIRAIDLIHEI